MTVDIELSAFFVGMYNRDKSSLGYLIESEAPKDVMLKVYDVFVKDGLIPIENLREGSKKELVAECRATGLSFTNQTLTDAAKILHVIKFING